MEADLAEELRALLAGPSPPVRRHFGIETRATAGAHALEEQIEGVEQRLAPVESKLAGDYEEIKRLTSQVN